MVRAAGFQPQSPAYATIEPRRHFSRCGSLDVFNPVFARDWSVCLSDVLPVTAFENLASICGAGFWRVCRGSDRAPVSPREGEIIMWSDASSQGWCIKLWDITSLGSVQVVGFFDVAARVCAGDGPTAALMGVYSGIFCISFTNGLVYRYIVLVGRLLRRTHPSYFSVFHSVWRHTHEGALCIYSVVGFLCP